MKYIAKYKKYLIDDPIAAQYFVTSISFFLVFLLGVGRFRVIIFYSFFSFLKGVFARMKITLTPLYLLFLPVLFLLILNDIKYGQVRPLFSSVNFAGALLITFSFDFLVRELAKRKIQDLTEYEVFFICPRCNFLARDFVRKCDKCGFQKGNLLDDSTDVVDSPYLIPEIAEEIAYYKKKGLYKIPTSKLRKLIHCMKDEYVLINLRMFPFRMMHKNGEKLLIKRLLITNKRILLIDFSVWGDGWIYKENIYIDQIYKVKLTEKRINIKNAPILILETQTGDEFEIFFSSFPNVKEKFRAIIDCIRTRNTVVLEE